MRRNLLPTTPAINPHAPRPLLLPASWERKIAARWREWEPWVRMYLQHRDWPQDGVPAEVARLRRRHSEQVVALIRAGIAMRLIRRHRLDDPRITDEARAVLVQDAMERRRSRLAVQCDLSEADW